VRARLVARPQDWDWSSARAHLAGRDNELVKVRPLLQRVGSALDLIGVEPDAATLAALRLADTTGRPLGSPSFLSGIERRLRRRVRPQRRGPKRRDATQAETMTLLPQRNSAIGKVSP
jgi:putative transposase